MLRDFGWLQGSLGVKKFLRVDIMASVASKAMWGFKFRPRRARVLPRTECIHVLAPKLHSQQPAGTTPLGGAFPKLEVTFLGS